MSELVERIVTLTNLPGYILPREACKDLAQEDSKDPSIFRMRVLLLTPGTWNDIDFTTDEIKGGVKRANDVNAALGFFRIPTVNGHNDDMTDIYGKVIGVDYGKVKTPEGEKEGSIFDLECRSSMPPGDKIRDLIGWAPELIRFSARLRGQWLLPQSGKENPQLVNFNFIHVGTVPDPACTDAGIIEQLRRKHDTGSAAAALATGIAGSDFDLSVYTPDAPPMATDVEKIAQLERELSDLKAKNADLEAQLKKKDEQLATKDAELTKAQKAPVIAAILALHKDADPKFLDSMSFEQLTAYDAELRKMITPAVPGSTERSLSGGSAGSRTPQQISLVRAETLFGPVRGR